MSSIPLSAQPGKPNPDTVRCYGLTELQYIAASLVEGRACDTLLQIANEKLVNRDSMVKEKEYQISKLMHQHELKDKLILEKDKSILDLNDKLGGANLQKKWLKFGWGATSVVLGGVILYLVVQ